MDGGTQPTMMIEDEELRGIFKTSSEERLQTLDDGLLHLEQHPDDQETVEALMREAHSLKGDSNMLGVPHLSKLAHQIEHVLGAIKRQEQVFSADTCDRLATGLNAMRQLVYEAVTGEPADVELNQVMATLKGAESTELSQATAELQPHAPPAADEVAPTTQPHLEEPDILDEVLLDDAFLLAAPSAPANPGQPKHLRLPPHQCSRAHPLPRLPQG
jgi:two-component system chemotaxis sensor kinase CheA